VKQDYNIISKAFNETLNSKEPKPSFETIWNSYSSEVNEVTTSINKQNRLKKSLKQISKYTSIAALVTLVFILAIGFISPVAAQTLSRLPAIGSVFRHINGNEIKSVEKKELTAIK
jgi:hypothetical protein